MRRRTMAEKKRTAAEIRAYCERLPRILQDVPARVNDVKSYRYGAYRAFAEMACVDLPRLLDVGRDCWTALDWLYRAVLHGRKMTEREQYELGSFIADTAWLAEISSKAADSLELPTRGNGDE